MDNNQHKWAYIIKKLIGPEFQKAFREAGAFGIGSNVGVSRCFRLIKENEWHTKNQNSEIKAVLDKVCQLLDTPMTDEDISKFIIFLSSKLMTLSACYMVIGAYTAMAALPSIQEKGAVEPSV